LDPFELEHLLETECKDVRLSFSPTSSSIPKPIPATSISRTLDLATRAAEVAAVIMSRKSIMNMIAIARAQGFEE
jgi:hypothetical protein